MTRPKGLDWMPFDIAAFYESERVARLSPAAEALYIRLLCRCFQHGSLPLTSAFVKPLFPKFAEGWDALWEEVRPLFDEAEERLVNARATAEREHAMKVLTARREAGKAGGRPPRTVSEANALHAQSKAKPQPNHSEPQDRDRDRDRTGHGSVPSELQPSPNGSAAASSNGSADRPKPPKPDAKKGPHVRAMEMFQRGWARIRCEDELAALGFKVTRETDPKDIPPAARYVPTVADWTAAARLWKQIEGDEELLKDRMTNFFESDAPYMRSGGFSLFASKFSVLIEPIMALQTNSTRE